MMRLTIPAVVVFSLLLCSPAAFSQQQRFGSSCEALKPSADFALSNWAPLGAGTHFSEVDDPVADASCSTDHDGDASYLDCDKSTACNDTFELPNGSGYSAANVVIDSVGAQVVCRRVNGTGMATGPVTVYLVIGGVDYAILSSQFCSLDTWQTGTTNYANAKYLNPATSARWTVADLDALRVKVSKPSTTSNWDTRLTDVSIIVGYHKGFAAVQDSRLTTGGGE